MNHSDSLEELWKYLGVQNKEDLTEAERLTGISKEIQDVYLWVLCALGIPGNILTMVVIVTMGEITPVSFLFVLLASYDGAALITKLVGFNMLRYKAPVTDFTCKLNFVPLFLTAMANWTLTLIALERFITVWFPFKKINLFTKKRTYAIAGVNAVIIFFLYATIFFVMWTAHPSQGKCDVKSGYDNFWRSNWHIINPIVLLFLPFLVIVSLLSIAGLTKYRRGRTLLHYSLENMDNLDSNQKLIAEEGLSDRMITVMLILASVSFLVLSTPACVYYLAHTDSRDYLIQSQWRLFQQISYLMLDCSHAINFFLYFIRAKQFRTRVIFCLKDKLSCKKDQSTDKLTESSTLVSTSK